MNDLKMRLEMHMELPEREAKHGEKMISLDVRFWTDGITEDKDKILPKNAWVHGTVRLNKNDSHGIQSGRTIPFNSLLELPAKIEDLLIEEGITLHLNRKMRRYIE